MHFRCGKAIVDEAVIGRPVLAKNQRLNFRIQDSERHTALSTRQGMFVAFWPAQSRITIKRDNASVWLSPILAIWFLFLDM